MRARPWIGALFAVFVTLHVAPPDLLGPLITSSFAATAAIAVGWRISSLGRWMSRRSRNC